MNPNQIAFIYNGANIIIQCRIDEKMKDIFQNFKFKAKVENKRLIYMYNGITIQNEELSFNEIANSDDKSRNKMNILVIDGERTVLISNDRIIKSKNIICEKCKEDIKFNIEDYNINLFECKNKHDIDNIFLDAFNSTQNINISKIICQNCGKYNKGNVHNNIFYKCNNCKKNLCPICYSNHDKNHSVINYDDKNYIFDKHNKICMAYCENCKINICIYCEQNHNGHNIKTYGKLIPDENKMNNLYNTLKQLEEIKNKLNNDINNIILKLNKVKDNYEFYFNIIKNIINNFNKEKINQEILYNINNINDNDILNDMINIIKDDNIINKYNKLMNI